MIERLILFLGGLGICLGTGYAIYWLVSLIVSGALIGNWLMVIAGGILAYFFIFWLIVGFGIGAYILLQGVID